MIQHCKRHQYLNIYIKNKIRKYWYSYIKSISNQIIESIIQDLVGCITCMAVESLTILCNKQVSLTDLEQLSFLHAPLVGERPFLRVGRVLVESTDGRQVYAAGTVRIIRVVSVRHVSRFLNRSGCLGFDPADLGQSDRSLLACRAIASQTDRQIDTQPLPFSPSQ